MPTYLTHCDCNPIDTDPPLEQWYPITTGLPKLCPECSAPLVQVIGRVNVVSANTAQTNRVDRNLAADRDAYKRLRSQGLQPQHVGGSSVLEKHAETQFEIEAGHLFPTAADRALVREGQERANEIAERLADKNKVVST